jgi:hypothetical protein
MLTAFQNYSVLFRSPANPSDDGGTLEVHTTVLPIIAPQTLAPPWDKITWLFRFRPRDLTLCASNSLQKSDAAQQLYGQEPVVWLQQGNNTCWLDAMLVAMRMQGIGRFVYDVTDELDDTTSIKSKVLALLVADWSREAHQLASLRKRIQDGIAQVAPMFATGACANPSDLWDLGAAGIPSVSFNVAKKKACTKCGLANYYQSRQDRVAGIQIPSHQGNKSTLPQLLNDHFDEHEIDHHKSEFSVCRRCKNPLPLVQKRVVVDRAPFILSIGVNNFRMKHSRAVCEW